MKNKFLPMMQGVVKDYHSRIIPENKVADCENVIFKQAKIFSRPGFKKLGPDTLNGAITGIAYYEQVRLGDKFVVVFTARDAYLYDVTTGKFTPITLSYNTGTVSVNCLDVTGNGTTWLNGSWVLDVYRIKFGSNNPLTDSLSFTGDVADYWAERTTSGSRSWKQIASSSDGSKLAACVYNGYIYTSDDYGATWTERTSAVSRTWLQIKCSADGSIIMASTAVTSSDGYVYVSTDYGANWTIVYPNSTSKAAFNIACSSDGSYMIAGDGAYIYKSEDYGSNWTKIGTQQHGLLACSSDGQIIVTGKYTGGYIYTSYDGGKTWEQRTTGSYKYYHGVSCSADGSKMMAVDYYNGYIYISSDYGVTWYPKASSGYWEGIACSSDGMNLIAIKSNEYIYISNDGGEIWYEKDDPGSAYWAGVAMSADGTKCAITRTSDYIVTFDFSIKEITSISDLSGLYVGLELSADFLAIGTRISGINFSTSVISIDLGAIGSATSGNITADISNWNNVKSVDSSTGITLDDVETTTGDVTSASPVIENIPDTSILYVGMGISGTGIPAETSILSIDSSSQITLSKDATATNTGVTLHFGVLIESGHEVNYVLMLCFNGDDDSYWSFAYPYDDTLGDKILTATNGIDPILKWDGSGSIEYLGVSGGPETAKYIGYFGAVGLERFFAAWTTDSGDSLPQTIELSDAGDAESWSGAFYDLLQKNDEIVGVEILKDRLVIYKKKSISLAYPDPSASDVATDPYNIIQDVIIDVEIPTGRTVVNFGDYHIFMAMDNIYKFNGIGIEPIGSEVINTMKNEWNGEYIHHSFAINIPQENLYALFYPVLSEFDETDMRTSYPNKAVVFNYVENTWTIWTFNRYFTCAAFVNKLYAPTVGDIDTLDVTWAWGQMRWSDLIAYSNIQSLLLGDVDGNIVELRDVYTDDDGTEINASFLTRDYVLNDPQHVLMLCRVILALRRKAETDTIKIRASVDFGRSWSAWSTLSEWGENDYLEKIAHFRRKGLQVRLEIANIDGAPFEIESIAIGFNDGMPDQIYGLGVKPSGD